MLHLITSRNAGLYRREVRSLHEARKTVFVDELGWQLPVRDGLEYDEYDDERASNIVGFSTEGEVVMGLRFRSTEDRSMLADHFSDWLFPDIRPLNDGKTWELSRGFCIERGVQRHHLRRKAACMIAPLEIALAHGIDRCVGFTDVRMLNFCTGVGWKLQFIGDPKPYEEGIAVAYELEVTEESVGAMRRMWGLPDPAYIKIDTLHEGETVHDAALRKVAGRPDLSKLLAQPEDDPALGMPPATAVTDHYDNYRMANG